jgi:hypothetical protein
LTVIVIVIVIVYSILIIQVDRLNPVETSESSNSRPKGFSVTRGQGDPWSMVYRALLAKPRLRIGGEITTFVERVTKLCNIEGVLTNNTKWKKNEHVSLEWDILARSHTPELATDTRRENPPRYGGYVVIQEPRYSH